MELLQRIWQENRRFLLMSGGGLAVFFILNSCAIESLISSAGDQRRDNTKLEKQVLDLQAKVFQRAGEEKKTLTDLAEIEKDLRARYLTPKPTSVPDPKRGGAAQIQFSELIDRIWNEVKAKANQKNVKLPEKVTTDSLGVASGDTAVEHEMHAAYLEILSRALHSCVDQGMVQIEKPVIHPEEPVPIPGNDDVVTIHRRVELTVQGPYEAFKRVLQDFEKPGRYAQVRLLSLDSKGPGGAAALRGRMEFVAVDFKEQGDGKAPVNTAPVKKRKKR